jgi:isoquinoline 1-oxidoreductase subunit alpha
MADTESSFEASFVDGMRAKSGYSAQGFQQKFVKVEVRTSGALYAFSHKRKKSLSEFNMTTLIINDKTCTVNAPPDMPLLWVLRDLIGLTGTKFGCGIAQCGACTVHLDGKAVRSCVLPIAAVGQRKVTTIEAVSATPIGKKVQDAWLALDVVQCGYCQSGQVMSAASLIALNPHPTDSDIDAAMGGNICRCGTYSRIRAAIKHAAKEA